MPSFHLSSLLRASPERVWAHATSMAGVNRELAPLLRMTHPRAMSSFEGRDVPLGVRLFRSVILLFGVLPIDYDDVTFEAIEPGRRFLERSRMLTQRTWVHERTIEPESSATRLTDRISFEPRIRWTTRGLSPILHRVFENRHDKLVRLFGGKRGAIEIG